jgi:hypothetical protein
MESVMRFIAVSSIALSILALSLLSVSAEAVVTPKKTDGPVRVEVGSPADVKVLEKSVINQLALASGHMMGRKAKAREALGVAERDLATLKEMGGDKAFISEQEETIADIKSIVR